MFKHLRNRIIVINMLTTTVVLFSAFSAIYFNARIAHGPEIPEAEISKIETESDNQRVTEYVVKKVNDDRRNNLNSLLFSLVVSGLAIEVIIFLVSLYLASEAIKPVRETYEAQKDFIANASHEIKTPLAAISANLEAADISDNHWIDNAIIKVDELTTLNNELLTLARADSIDQAKNEVEIDLPEFIDDMLAPYEPQIQKKHITLSVGRSGLKKPVIKINEPAFRQILNILIDNAIKYTNQKIVANLTDTSFIIKNDGTIIKSKDIDRIFDRFYQTDKNKAGVGLGLAIAKQVADKNHWRLSASSTDKYTTFTLKFK